MFFEKRDDGIVLRVRLTPNASACMLTGIYTDGAGVEFLKVSVCSVPEKGKANKELVAFLAKKLKTAKSAIALVSGNTDRCKKLLIAGGEDIAERVAGLAEEIK